MSKIDYKELSIREFSIAAENYETDHAGVYNMCKKDYPDILEELEKEDFNDLLDCGCGTAPVISLLYEKYPEKHYTGIDLTPKMIEAARAKNLPAEFIVGDCENLPFEDNSFDTVICSQSFHHYPNPQDFFNGVYRVLKPNGRLILRDMTSFKPALLFMNTIEMPIVNHLGKGDYHVYSTDEVRDMCEKAGLTLEIAEHRFPFRLHCVARKKENIKYSEISASYKASSKIYDNVLNQESLLAKAYIKTFWNGADDRKIAEKLLGFIPDDFSGKLLDVPVGTAVFTYKKYTQLKNAEITCIDYSRDMLEQAEKRFNQAELSNITSLQGDVGNMPFENGKYDIVLSMNGFHAFPDKKKAYLEIYRVLKRGGKFIGCFYIKGESKITDALVRNVLAVKGWFTPPFDTIDSLQAKLNRMYIIQDIHVEGSMVWFCAVKK